MKQHRQHSKHQDEKKAPSTAELRRATWSSIEQIVALLMKLMFEILLDRAATEQIGALPYERTGSRKTYRNGAYRRSLGTRFGTIEDLLVPRFREVRRRTRPMGGTFVNPESADRIYHNVIGLLNTNWKNQPSAFTQNS